MVTCIKSTERKKTLWFVFSQTSFRDSVLKDLDDDPLTASKRKHTATPQKTEVSCKSDRKSEQFRNIEMKQESFLAIMKSSTSRARSGAMKRYRKDRLSRSPPPRSRRHRSPPALVSHRHRHHSPSSRKRISPPRKRHYYEYAGGKWDKAPPKSISPSRRRRNPPHLSSSSVSSKERSHERSRSKSLRDAERREAGKDEQQQDDLSPIRVNVDDIVVIDEDKDEDDVEPEVEPLPPGTE